MNELQVCLKSQLDHPQIRFYSTKVITLLIIANEDLVKMFRTCEVLPKLIFSGKTESVLFAVRIIGRLFNLNQRRIYVLLSIPFLIPVLLLSHFRPVLSLFHWKP